MNQARSENEWQETFGGGFGDTSGKRLMNVPLALLDPWKDENGESQPFRAYSEAELRELAENVRQHGVITPLRLRPMGRRFQILSGHNRCEAARMVGLSTVPAIVEDVDDDEAAQILVDSNLQQRQKLLPSEKAFAYRLKLDSQKHQGKRTDLTSSQFETKLRSDERLAVKSEDSRASIQRYIRLTYLIPELLQMVDAEKLKLIAGVELSFLSQSIQAFVLQIIREENVKISTAKAKQLHKTMPETEDAVRTLLQAKTKTPALSIKLELAELSEQQYTRLAANEEFQKELHAAVVRLAAQYLA